MAQILKGQQFSGRLPQVTGDGWRIIYELPLGSLSPDAATIGA